MAGPVALQGHGHSSLSPGIGGKIPGIVSHFGHRHQALQKSICTLEIRLAETGPHLLQIGQGMAQTILGHLQAETVDRLQKDGSGHHKTLADRSVGGLAEVSALRVLFVGPAADDGDLHIRDVGPRQDAPVASFLQMGQDQSLPVAGQHVDRAVRGKDKAGTRISRLQQQMDLRIVTQGLEMSHALHRGRYGLLIYDGRGPVVDPQVEAVPGLAAQDLPLHLAHDLGRDLLFGLVVGDMKDRILLFQLPQVPVGLEGILGGRQKDGGGKDRLQKALGGFFLTPQALARIGGGQARDRADHAGPGLLQGLKPGPVIDPDLVRLLLYLFSVPFQGQDRSGPEASPRQLHPGEPPSALLSADLKDPGPEVLLP